MKATESPVESKLFYTFLALLVWLPLPFGSNRVWAEAIFELWVAAISLFWLREYYFNRVSVNKVFSGARFVLVLLLLWLVYVILQLIPLPEAFRIILSARSVEIYQQSGQMGWLPISLLPYETFLFWLKSIAYVALFGLTLLLVNSKYRLVLLGYTLVLSAVFQAFYGSMMTLSGLEYSFFIQKYAYLGFATGTFINRNHLAGYLEMASAIGIGLLMATSATKEHGSTWRHRIRNILHVLLSQKLLLRLMLAMMVIALVLTRSRMGNTGFFVSMLVAGLITLVIYRGQANSFKEMFNRSETRSAVILIVSLLIIDMLIVGAWFGVDKLADRIAQSSLEHDAGRVEVSINTLNLLKDYQLTGAGGGSFHVVYAHYRGDGIAQYYDHAHQDYLEILSDVGVIGTSLLGLIVLSSFWTALKALQRRRDRLLRGMAFASIMATIALLIHSMVDFNLQIPANAATFMVVLALGWIALNLESDTKKRVKIHPENEQEIRHHAK
jgi:O-antigen ligase